MEYYALGNVVYNQKQDVVCVIAPVWLLKSIACYMASVTAQTLNDLDTNERDVLRGSLD